MAIVTISRGSLSGGRAVAECLADRLGYRCLAREILEGAADKIEVTEDHLRSKFETTPGIWARLVEDRDRYIVAVQSALAEACVEGDLVYHGLAGQFLLAGLPGVLRVRLIAPLDMRVDALTRERHRMTREAAVDFIRNIDEERRRWVRLTYGEEVEDPSLYDLTVNLRLLTLDAACATIAEAVEQPEFEATEEVQKRFESYARECRESLEAVSAGEA